MTDETGWVQARPREEASLWPDEALVVAPAGASGRAAASLDPPTPQEQADLQLLRASGLFDGEWFLAHNPDLMPLAGGMLLHFHRWGWREGRQPNLYFDPAWYSLQYCDVGQTSRDPLLHYVLYGEAEGRRPIAWFDPGWYRKTYRVPEGVLALGHFLGLRKMGAVSPVPEFDPGFYLAQSPDVADAGMDPFEHYLVQGFREGRAPSPGFDPEFYRRMHLDGDDQVNPLLHFRAQREAGVQLPTIAREQPTIAREVRRRTQPSDQFELVTPLPDGVKPRAQALAFYLPQFHAVPENDVWWGEGFTEWTNVARAVPRFEGHYQPRIPRDLGHYSLHGTETLARQIALAKGAGLSGFVFYFYWFNGRRLLDAPLEALLADHSLDVPFCLMWANENWSRRWDGGEADVLIAQTYRPRDERGLVATFARHFADPRYIRLQGRPLLMIYRPGLIPAAPRTIARWRRLFRDGHGEDPIFVMSQSFGATDPRDFGMDAAVEFPPHKITSHLSMVNERLTVLDAEFEAQVFDYADVIAHSLGEKVSEFPLIKTAVPSWDNDARRQGRGLVLHGATPALYQSWLSRLVSRAVAQPVFGTPLVCINAWNEWAEAAYLEPDVHFGAAMLNATGRALTVSDRSDGRAPILLVGHDAFPAGAQLLLLNIGRQLARRHGVAVRFLLLGDGELRAQYEQVGVTDLACDEADLARAVTRAVACEVRAAIVNSVASARACPVLREARIVNTLLVHELPGMIGDKGLVETARRAVRAAATVVFPANVVRDRFNDLIAEPMTRCVVQPQGLYAEARFIPARRRALRRALGVADDAVLMIGIGYADLRKGFDLFLQTWRRARALMPTTHGIWLGAADPSLRASLGGEIAAAMAIGAFHMPGYRTDAVEFLSAADVFLLTSREDPYPSVALEAMATGLPVVAFEGTGGIPGLLHRTGGGATVALGDIVAMAESGLELARRAMGARPGPIARAAVREFDFPSYVTRLLSLAVPLMPTVSAVVPSYNYGRYSRDRLVSIFAQTAPLAETIVLDDASSDDSVAVARMTAEAAEREIAIVRNRTNSGSVFRQWARAAEMARGEWLWIAEADDCAEPEFVATLASRLANTEGAVLGFCDSRAIDADGRTVMASYQEYYASAGADALARDGVFEGQDFLRRLLFERNMILNASAVIWRRSALREAIERCGADELERYRMAGDWRLYAELLSAPGARVVYVASPLNIHRRHADSVTGSIRPRAHLGEIMRMHGLLARRLGATVEERRRQRAYHREVARALTAAR